MSPGRNKWSVTDRVYRRNSPQNQQIPTASGEMGQKDTDIKKKKSKRPSIMEELSMLGIFLQFSIECFSADTESLCGFLPVIIKKM